MICQILQAICSICSLLVVLEGSWEDGEAKAETSYEVHSKPIYVMHGICIACQMDEAPNQTITILEKVEVGDEGGLKLFVAGLHHVYQVIYTYRF